MSIYALNRYPRWGDAGDDTTSASANSKSPPPSVPTVTAAAKTLADESHGFERTASSCSSSSGSVGYLENVSNLSPSVQKLLREFATDSDDLTGSDSASMLQSSSLPKPSKDQDLGHHVDDQIRVATEENVLVSPPNVNQPADTDTALPTTTMSTANTLAPKADITQVLGSRFFTKHYP